MTGFLQQHYDLSDEMGGKLACGYDEYQKSKVVRKNHEVIASENVFDGKIIKVFKNDVHLDGKTVKREIVQHEPVAAVIVLKDDEIMFVRQYRHGAQKELLELPAGNIEEGEYSLNAAKRELREETGCVAKVWTRLGKLYSSPGFLTEYVNFFLAEEPVFMDDAQDDDERITVEWHTIEEIMKMISDNDIQDAHTVAGIFLASTFLAMQGKHES